MSSFLFSSLHYIGRFLFACVLLLSLAMSFSLPLSSNLYIIRTHLDGAAVQTSKGLSVTGVSEIRFGVWGACYYNSQKETCDYDFEDKVTVTQGKNVAHVNWLRAKYVGIAQLVVTIVILFGFIVYTFDIPGTHLFTRLHRKHMVYYGLQGMAMAILLAALIINLQIFSNINSDLHKLGTTEKGKIGFWFTIISLVLIPMCGIFLYLYRRHQDQKCAIANQKLAPRSETWTALMPGGGYQTINNPGVKVPGSENWPKENVGEELHKWEHKPGSQKK